MSALRDLAQSFSKAGSKSEQPKEDTPANASTDNAGADSRTESSKPDSPARELDSIPDSAPAAKTPAAANSKKRRSSDKELQKLRRVDLLELLVGQIRENDRLASENEQLADLSERLKGKLDEKDAQIEHLKQRLNMKDEQIQHLEERNRVLSHIAGTLDVSEFALVEERAVNHYLQQLREQGDISYGNPDAQASRGIHTR